MLNLYIRYFDQEVVVCNFEDALDFLESIDIELDKFLVDDLYNYYTSTMPYPKRYKTHHRNYFIVIKTTASTLTEFKETASKGPQSPIQSEKESQAAFFSREQMGWYEVSVTFKRVVTNLDTGKCSYQDEEFVARLKGISIKDCYDRVIDYLKQREDIDERSQFPSIRNRNFICEYLGTELQDMP